MIPVQPYVALFGSHSGGWWDEAARALLDRGVRVFDPRDPGWSWVTEDTGDTQQDLVNALVASQHKGLHGASCVVYHLARRWSVEPDVLGRNYLWAMIAIYPHMARCGTLAEAIEGAATFGVHKV